MGRAPCTSAHVRGAPFASHCAVHSLPGCGVSLLKSYPQGLGFNVAIYQTPGEAPVPEVPPPWVGAGQLGTTGGDGPLCTSAGRTRWGRSCIS